MLRYETSRVFVLVAILSITLWCTVQDVGAGKNDDEAGPSRTKEDPPNKGTNSDESEFKDATSQLNSPQYTSTREIVEVPPSQPDSPQHTREIVQVPHEERSVEASSSALVTREANPNETLGEEESYFDEDEIEMVLPGQNMRKSFDHRYKSLRVEWYSLKKIFSKKRFVINVRENYIYDDSYQLLTTGNARDCLLKKIKISFDGDGTEDKGGLTRKWFYLLSKEIFNPERGLFQYVDANKRDALRVNPKSGENNPDHLHHFEFVGRFLGLAIYYGKRIRVNLIQPFYKRILNKRIGIKDTNELIKLDSQYQQFVNNIKRNPSSISFSTPEGNKPMTSNNEINEFLRLVTDWEYLSKVEEQMLALIEGLRQIIPLHMLRYRFNEKELEKILCDNDALDIEKWQKHTLYWSNMKKTDGIIRTFWDIIGGYNENQRRRILQFVTGSDALSLESPFGKMYPPFQISEPPLQRPSNTIYADINNRTLMFSHQAMSNEFKKGLDRIANDTRT